MWLYQAFCLKGRLLQIKSSSVIQTLSSARVLRLAVIEHLLDPCYILVTSIYCLNFVNIFFIRDSRLVCLGENLKSLGRESFLENRDFMVFH